MGAGPDVIKGASEVSNTASGAAQANNATLAATAGKTNYVEGFILTGGGATGASIIDVTLTGLAGGTMTFHVPIPAGATTSITPLYVFFPRPRAATGINTAITLNVPSFGTGNTKAAAVLYGYRK